MSASSISRIRERVIVGLVAVFVATAVYTFLGFAWTFKNAVETVQRMKQPFHRGY